MSSESRLNQPPQSEDVSWRQWFGMAVVATAILAGLEFMVYHALSRAENGDPSAATWEPIVVVYELWGYGAALAVIPALWLLLAGIVSWQTWQRLRDRKPPQRPTT
jgi:hypothetical protein